MELKRIALSIKQVGCLVIAALLLIESVFFPIQAAAGERILYYHNDAVGSPVAMTDSSGNVVWRADYEPFGDEWTLNETVPNSHRFTGKEVDLETDLHYFGARYYDTELGRFLSVDPALLGGRPPSAITIPQRLNFYAYATNNPYRYLDPNGAWVESAWDVVSLGLSISAFYDQPSLVNALFVAVDAVAVALPLLPGGAGAIAKGARIAEEGSDVAAAAEKVGSAAREGGQVFERVMTNAELKATQETGLLRGGREGANFFTNSASLDAKRAQQRLGLEGPLRDQRVRFKIKGDVEVSGPRTAPGGSTGTPGGGREFSTEGPTPIEIIRVDPLRK